MATCAVLALFLPLDVERWRAGHGSLRFEMVRAMDSCAVWALLARQGGTGDSLLGTLHSPVLVLVKIVQQGVSIESCARIAMEQCLHGLGGYCSFGDSSLVSSCGVGTVAQPPRS